MEIREREMDGGQLYLSDGGQRINVVDYEAKGWKPPNVGQAPTFPPPCQYRFNQSINQSGIFKVA